MGKGKQNKITVDVNADRSSLDSLSFAGFASIHQDQQKKPPLNNTKEEEEFEFDSTVRDSIQGSPADALISNGQLLPQAYQFQSKNQADKMGSHSQSRSQNQSQTYGKRSSQKEKRGKGNSDEAKQGERNKAKEKTARHGVFRSFMAPCRTCQATEPMVRAENIRGGK